ncbi:hypothetical protein ACHHYP_20812 [Achlya hypogyna]|uniref:DUF4371 domain-containing protein n=1 Tax=Achlya hypogyna TaxID=1202772 RepID=A0A1V9Y902_ACHHY|nr:hypothetical protein ACHHYP_20812 [Achlya hypogyna]
MARYLCDNAIRVRMLGVVELVAGTSNAVFAAVMHLLEDLDLNYRNIVGFASDGASVMLGSRNGAAMKLKAKIPHLVTSHCPTHRLNLAAEDAEGPYEEERMSLLKEAIERFQAKKLLSLY